MGGGARGRGCYIPVKIKFEASSFYFIISVSMIIMSTIVIAIYITGLSLKGVAGYYGLQRLQVANTLSLKMTYRQQEEETLLSVFITGYLSLRNWFLTKA